MWPSDDLIIRYILKFIKQTGLCETYDKYSIYFAF